MSTTTLYSSLTFSRFNDHQLQWATSKSDHRDRRLLLHMVAETKGRGTNQATEHRRLSGLYSQCPLLHPLVADLVVSSMQRPHLDSVPAPPSFIHGTSHLLAKPIPCGQQTAALARAKTTTRVLRQLQAVADMAGPRSHLPPALPLIVANR